MASTINANNTTGLVSTADTSGILQLQTNGTTAVTVDDSQRVGVGVTPSAWNAIFKSIDIGTTASFAGSSGGANVFNNAYWSGSDYIYKTTAAATRYLQSSGEHYWYRAASGTAGNTISFTQAMTLDASGNLLVGTTNSSATSGNGLKVTSGSGNADAVSVVTGATSNAGLTTYQLYSTGAGAYRFYVGAAGTIFATNTAISAISDARLKENIVDLDVGLDKIMALKPRKFDWKEGKGTNTKNVRGFIAQELEQVFPDLIDDWRDPAPEGEDPYKSVRQDLMPVLVKAIQEQQAIIESLKARLDAANL